MKTFTSLFALVCLFGCAQDKLDTLETNIVPNSTEELENVENKINPVIPDHITFHLKDREGNLVSGDHMFYRLEFYIGSKKYPFYYPVTPQVSSDITFTKKELIAYSDLQDQIDESLPRDHTPVKFEMLVVNPNKITKLNDLFKSIDLNQKPLGFTDVYPKVDKELLLKRVDSIKEKHGSDLEFFKTSAEYNKALETTNVDIKMTGEWGSESNYEYDLVIR